LNDVLRHLIGHYQQAEPADAARPPPARSRDCYDSETIHHASSSSSLESGARRFLCTLEMVRNAATAPSPLPRQLEH
jgi:hypothetical protein